MLSVKQGDIEYHFLSLWYNSTWEWTLVSQTIGEHTTTYTNLYKIHIYINLKHDMCFNVQMYIYIHVSIYIYIYIRLYMSIYIYIYICVCVCIYVYMYTFIFVCTYVYTYMYVFICICKCTHTHTHTHTYIYIYICSKSWSSLLAPIHFWGLFFLYVRFICNIYIYIYIKYTILTMMSKNIYQYVLFLLWNQPFHFY